MADLQQRIDTCTASIARAQSELAAMDADVGLADRAATAYTDGSVATVTKAVLRADAEKRRLGLALDGLVRERKALELAMLEERLEHMTATHDQKSAQITEKQRLIAELERQAKVIEPSAQIILGPGALSHGSGIYEQVVRRELEASMRELRGPITAAMRARILAGDSPVAP